MKKSTKVGITFTVLTVLVLGLGIVFAVLVNNEKTLLEDMSIIKRTYANFSGDVIDIYQLRKSLTEKMDIFIDENYEEEHEVYIEILTTYNQKMVSLNNNIAILEDKCSFTYEDVETNIFCSYYQQTYEAVNNIYINQYNKYNELITNYNQNEENEKDYDLVELVNKEFIDFDKNGTYDGKEDE